MKEEYTREELGKGRRGTHYQAYHAIQLDEDVAKHFKDAESVNNALRMLIRLAEKEVPQQAA